MSTTALRQFDVPINNNSFETIPACAVVEVNAPGMITIGGREWFTVQKPTRDGKTFFVNGPRSIRSGGSGLAARVERTPGVHALVDPALNGKLAVNSQLGPVPGQWWLGEGSGFYVIGRQTGVPPSEPGFPPSPSTIRVRVTASAVSARPENRVRGRVNQTVWPELQKFPINHLIILSGEDQREIDGDPLEPLIVNNTLRKSYTSQVDWVTALQNEQTKEWNVVEESGGAAIVSGKLLADFTTAEAEARIKVTFSADQSTPVDTEITAANPQDFIRRNPISGTTYHLFCGNKDGIAWATKSAEAWQLLAVQAPTKVPLRPTDE